MDRQDFRFGIISGGFMTAIMLFAGCVDSFEPRGIPVADCADTVLVKRPHPSIGEYSVYYGSFHNHTGISDGSGMPRDAYTYAKCRAGLDFLGISDHDYCLTPDTWQSLKDAADACTVDSVFAAFWGLEWTSDTYGHMTVVNAGDYTTGSNPGTKTLQLLCSWLTERDCFAMFNHPGEVNVNDEFDHFLGPVCDKIAGMELWNKGRSFSSFYYADGYFSNDSSKGFYDEALGRGWKIGASGGFDDHAGTWGTASDFRVAVLAKNLFRRDIFEAMLARRFYSTLDKNIALSFRFGENEMGSNIRSGTSGLRILASDGDGEIVSEVILFDKTHAKRRIWHPDATVVDITDTVSAGNGDYYYVKVTQEDGDEAISSPIWVADSNTVGVY
jgi:hypothetical protein